MLFNSYSYEILYEQFHWIYLQEDIQLLLVAVNNRLKFEIEIVHDLSCHPILTTVVLLTAVASSVWRSSKLGSAGVCIYCDVIQACCHEVDEDSILNTGWDELSYFRRWHLITSVYISVFDNDKKAEKKKNINNNRGIRIAMIVKVTQCR